MRIFVSGPYGDHNPPEIIAANVAHADAVARRLVAEGHEVYCAHKMQHGWERDARLCRDDFLRVDESFLRHWAQGIVRLLGDSPGADWECGLARERGLVIYWPGEWPMPILIASS